MGGEGIQPAVDGQKKTKFDMMKAQNEPRECLSFRGEEREKTDIDIKSKPKGVRALPSYLLVRPNFWQ